MTREFATSVRPLVRAAQEKMRALIRTAEVTGDLSTATLQGLAGVLNAMHVMTSKVGLRIEAALAEAKRTVS